MHINLIILLVSIAFTGITWSFGLDLLLNGKPLFAILGFITIMASVGLLGLIVAILLEIHPHWKCLLRNRLSSEKCRH